MEDFQKLRYNADQRAAEFCLTHNGRLILIEEYAAEKLAFDEEMLAIGHAIEKQGVDNIPLAADKVVDKDSLAAVVIKYALRGSVKAHQLGLLELELGLSKAVSYIAKADDQTAITRAKALIKLMFDNSGVLTNILPDNITEMNADLTEFTDDKNKPKQAIQVKKATGTDLIGPLLDEIDVPSHNIGKLVHSYCPDLADEWDEVTKVGASTGVRHLRLVVVYSDLVTGVKLPKVKGSLSNGVDAPIVKYSTKIGSMRDKDVTNGNYVLTSSLAGYVSDVRSDIGIEAGEIVHLEIKLKKL